LTLDTALKRNPARTRVLSVAVYCAIFLWSVKQFGIPVDRIAVVAWILVAFIFANVGKPWREQTNMLRDDALCI